MTDIEIMQTFRKIKESGTVIPDHLNKLVKGLRSWHRKTGGLSEKQQHLLQDIEKQIVYSKVDESR